MIRVTDLRKRFGDSEILKGITFEMRPQTCLLYTSDAADE